MKSYTILVSCILLASAFVSAHEDGPPEEWKEHISTCAEKLNMDMEKFKNVKEIKEDPEAMHKFGCLADCVMTKIGVINDGRPNIENMQEVARTKHKSSPAKVERLKECIEGVDQSMDPCSRALGYMACGEELKE